ncbi:MAG: bacterial extracellular solute-binding family protein [Betaproteobacteria bacterium]|nr:bacterial extracellular solute-binding family protein [Betaproteobacteria bacterium]
MAKTETSEPEALTVLTSNSIRGVLAVLGPDFERRTGYALTISYDPAQVMLRRIAAGETGDVAILGTGAIDTLAAEGKIDAGTRRTLARCGVGLAVRAGAPKPDVSTVDALKKTLLETPSIIYTSEGASGIHFARVIEELGIADAVRAKAHRQTGGLVAERLAAGEVELAVQQIPELLAVSGVELVGPLPEPLQTRSVSTAALFTGTRQRTAAQAFIDFLATPDAARIFRQKGHEPA